MANDNPYTMTPGSAVADQLQNILAQKRLEARQNMLDDIKRQDTQSQIQYRQDQADTNRMYREMYGDERAAIAEKVRAQGDEIARRATALQNYQIPTELPSHVKSQLELAKQSGDYDLLKQIITNWQKPDPSEQGSDIFVVGPDGNVNDSGQWAPKGAHVAVQPRPPQPPAATITPQVIYKDEPDPDDPTKKVQVGYWVKPGQTIDQGVRMGAIHKKDETSSTVPKPPRISAMTAKNFAAALDAVQRRKGDPRLETNLKNQAAMIARELQVPNHVTEGVLAAYADPRNRGLHPKAFLDVSNQPLVGPEAEAAQSLWTTLNGGYTQALPPPQQ